MAVTAGTASASTSTVNVSSSTVASGNAVTLTLQVKDAAGNNLTSGGLTVVFSNSGGTSTGTIGSTTDHGNGTYTASFTGITAGSATTIGATINAVAVTSTLPTVAVTPGTASTSTSTVNVSSSTVASGNAVTLTLQAKDAAGNNLTAGGLTVVFSNSGGTSTGTIGGTTDHGNGTYSASFTGVAAGSATTIGATIDAAAVTSALPSVTVTPGTASTSTSTVNVSSSTVASGSAVTLTLQAKDAAGNNLTAGGLTVVFSNSGGTSTGTIGGTTDHGDGTYTASFTGVAAGSATTIGATINAVAVTSTLPTVAVTPGTASTSTSTINVSSSTVASGSAVTLTLQAKDAAGNNLTAGGLTVAFSNSGGTSTGTIGSTTDHGDGTYTASFTGVTAGSATTIGATINTVTVTSSLPSVTVTAGTASTCTSTVNVSSSTVASGNAVTLTLQAKDAAGNNLSSGGLTVVFSNSGGTSTGTIGSTTDHGDGTYTASFTGVTAGSATTIGATINAAAVTSTLPTLSVTPGTASTSTSTVNVSSSTVASGSAVTLTLQAKDAAGNNLSSGGLTVVFSNSGGTSTGTIGGTTDHGDGTYTASFTGVAAGSATTIGATINAAAVTSSLPTLMVTPGTASTSTSTVNVSSSTVASGNAVTLTLQAKDAAGNNLTAGGLTVVFSNSGGTSTGTIGSTTDHGDGTYTASFTGVTAGSATTIGATINAVAVTSSLPTVTVTVGTISTSTSTVSVSSGTVTSGSAITLTLQAKDAGGNNITTGGETIAFTEIGGTSTGSIGSTTDNGNGTYTASFTGVLAGTATTIHATINAVAVTSALPTVTVGAAAATKLVFTTEPASTTAGAGLGAVVTAQDNAGNTDPTFVGTVSLAITSGTGTANAHLLGTASEAATSGVANFSGVNVDSVGSGYTLTATASGPSNAVSTSFNVTPGAISAAQSVITVASDTVISDSVDVLTLQGRDAFGNRVTTGGAAVIFAASGGTSTDSITATTDSTDGIYTAKLYGLVAGIANTISATVNGTGVTTTLPTIKVVHGKATHLILHQQPTDALVNATIAPPVVVYAVDNEGNLDPSFSGGSLTVAILIATDPSGTATLNGTTMVTPSAGVATFSDLSIDTAGTGYTLEAADLRTPPTGLGLVISNAFNIN